MSRLAKYTLAKCRVAECSVSGMSYQRMKKCYMERRFVWEEVLPKVIAARAPPPSFSTPPVLAICAKILDKRSKENTRRPPVWLLFLPSCRPLSIDDISIDDISIGDISIDDIPEVIHQ